MNNNTSATFILLSPSRRILVHLRDDGGEKKIPYPNMWNFPGGEKADDESYLGCVVREAQEEFEIGVNPERCELIHIYDHDHVRDDHVFVCRVDMEEKPPIHEGAGARWMSLDKIKSLELGWGGEGLIPYIEEIIERGKKG